MKLFISEQGSGNCTGQGKEQAIAWDNGRGLTKAIEKAEPGDTLILCSGSYRLTQPILWNKSGQYSNPIRLVGEGQAATGGQYGQSVWPTSQYWPTIKGERPAQYSADHAETGSDFIHLQQGVKHVVIEQLVLENFASAIVAAGGRNEGITVQSIRANNLRQFAAVGQVGHAVSLERNRSNDWSFSRCYLSGISKNAIYANGLQDSSFYDIYADCKDPSGQIHSDDWPRLFHCTGGAQYLRFQRCCGVRPSDTKNHSNSSSFSTDKGTTHVRFSRCIAYLPDNAGFDIEGTDHELYACYTEKVGNRAYRIQGSAILSYCMAEGQQAVSGNNAAIWIDDGSATVSHFVGRDMERPIALNGKGSARITNSRFELSRHLRSSGYTLRNRVQHDSDIRERDVKYRLT